jgi:DNA-directed RNA polymerase specialized sigma24 family protein
LSLEINKHYPLWRAHAKGLAKGDPVKGDDLLSETMLKLLDTARPTAERLAAEGKLYWYVNRCLYFMAITKNSNYNKTRRYSLFWDAEHDIAEIKEETWLGARLDTEYIDAYTALMNEAEAIILRLYSQPGFSYRQVSAATGIEIRDLYKLVEIAINKLRKNVKISNNDAQRGKRPKAANLRGL